MLVNFEQRHLIAIQFQQHVQLLAQHFAMTYMHPDLHILSEKCKENLNHIRYVRKYIILQETKLIKRY